MEEQIMTPQKSPGGSLFPYYYKDGELFGLHYGSFFENEEGLLARMKAEEQFLSQVNCQLPIWVDFYETRLTEKVLIEFSNSIIRWHGHIPKLAIVGCSFIDKRRLHTLNKKLGYKFTMPIKFFNDPEEAKTWLVRESFQN
jgi:hypothetical protein